MYAKVRSRVIIKIFVIRHRIICANINVLKNCIFGCDVDFRYVLFTFHMERFVEPSTNFAFIIIVLSSGQCASLHFCFS